MNGQNPERTPQIRKEWRIGGPEEVGAMVGSEESDEQVLHRLDSAGEWGGPAEDEGGEGVGGRGREGGGEGEEVHVLRIPPPQLPAQHLQIPCTTMCQMSEDLTVVVGVHCCCCCGGCCCP